MTLPRREEVPEAHTWDIESIFTSLDDWEEAYRMLEQELPGLADFRGRLSESPDRLLAWLQTIERLGQMANCVYVYSHLRFDADTTNQANAALNSRAQSLIARYRAATAFAEPEILAIDPAEIERFLQAEPRLHIYRHFLHNVQRQRAHVRSADVEDVLARASEPLETPWNTYRMLADGDLSFSPVSDTSGQQYQVAQGTIDDLLHSHDRTLRKAAWETYSDGFLSVKNTMAALIAGNVKSAVFHAQVRNYPGACAAALAAANIPEEVYTNVIESCNRHLHIWHRYWDIRRRALGLEKLEVYDIFAPLTDYESTVTYEQAVEWIHTGMAPLGSDYTEPMHAGLTRERWVDMYPNQGKRGGAYSSGAYATHPFILMSYSDDMESMSTLAHEIGHSMHSYMTNAHQPFIYSDYTIFVAEVASNFNQAMTRASLLRQNSKRDFQIAVLEEAMRNFHRYLFLMPILAQFELHIHEQVEHNQALTADGMSAKLCDLFRRGYGDAMHIDEARVGITWAQFPHMYASFYVYQYASGIAAANALADRVLAGEADAAHNYLSFLKAGSSLYPLDALKLAGIDMTSSEPMDRAFKVLEGFVNRLDQMFPTT
jgi:oligoendopeptidase F